MSRPPDEIQQRMLVVREQRRDAVKRNLRKGNTTTYISDAEKAPPTLQERLSAHAERQLVGGKIKPRREAEALQVHMEVLALELSLT